MKSIEAYRYVAAMATLEKWYMVAQACRFRKNKRRAKALGIVYHDRYLCGDADKGRWVK